MSEKKIDTGYVMILITLVGLLMTFYFFGIYTTLPVNLENKIFGGALSVMYVMFTFTFCETVRLVRNRGIHK